MAKWEINITRTQEMSAIVEADSYEEALAIYEDPESNCEDYEIGNGGEVRLDCIVKVEESKCDDCGELALEDNACADHKGECFDCCGCGQLEDAAAK